MALKKPTKKIKNWLGSENISLGSTPKYYYYSHRDILVALLEQDIYLFVYLVKFFKVD